MRPDLGTLFRPRGIAVVGASDKSYFSRTLVANLTAFGLADRVHLVNPRSGAAHGVPTVARVADIDQPVDVAFTMLPPEATWDTLTELGQAGIPNAVVMTSGYAEVGEAGRLAQSRLVQHARSLGITVLGPNMLGYANFLDGVPVTPIPNLPRTPGSVALLSQSGASSSAMLEFANTADVGLSYLVTLGNEAMVTAGHVLDHLVGEGRTAAVAIFLEAVRDPEVFRSAARRAIAAGIPVVVLKAGRSELAARSAAAHTGALVGDHATVAAALADAGVIVVDTIEDMLVTAGLAARVGRLSTPGAGVVSISGGACDILADLAADEGLALPALAAHTSAALTEVMPDYGTVQNPLDMTGAAVADPSLSTTCIRTVAADPSVGIVLAVNKLPWQPHEDPFSGQAFLDAIGAGAAGADVPVVFVNQVMQPITSVTRSALHHGGVEHAICGLREAVTAVSRVAWWSQQQAGAPVAVTATPVLAALDVPRGQWSEARVRDLLQSAGVPVVPAVHAATAQQAVDAARLLGEPVAVKLACAQVTHKTDIGAVRLDVSGADAVADAFADVCLAGTRVPGAVVDGALVSPMRRGGIELLVGVVNDPAWGPMLALALGGVLVEALRDSALAPLPVSAPRVREMLTSLRAAALFDGVRGAPPADLDAVVDAVVRIADLALALGPDLESLEVNPLRVDGAVVEALDAALTWRDLSRAGAV